MALTNLKAPLSKTLWDTIKNYVLTQIALADAAIDTLLATKIDKTIITNAATGAESVTINAKSGIATFTTNINSETEQIYSIKSSFVNASSVIFLSLRYTPAAGEPTILHYKIEGDDIIIHIKNIDTSNATAGNIIVNFLITN
jgi:hypothetical protein